MNFIELICAIVIGLFAFKLIDLALGIVWGWLFD